MPRSLTSSSLLALALLSVSLLPGCPKRVVVVDGVEMDYEAASGQAFEHARAAYDAGRFEDAVQALREYLATYPDADRSDEARWLLAQSLEQLDRTEEAEQAYTSLLEHHPLSPYAPRARLALGLAHLQLGEYNDALQVLRPAYEKLSGDDRLEAARALSEAAVGISDWQEAVRWVGEVQALARTPERRAEAEALLLDLVDAKIPATGLVELESELDPASPAHALVVLKLAKIQYHLRDYRRASEWVSRYLAQWPDGPHAAEARALAERLERLATVKPTVVGVLLPLSGDYKVYGDAVMRGIGMAIDVEKGPAARSPVTLVVRDTKGDPDAAAKAVEDLVLNEQVVAVIGPLLSSTATSAAAKAEELGVPMVSLSTAEGLPDLGGWIFRNALTHSAQAKALVDYAVDELGAKRFGILYPNHSYGKTMMDAFWTEVEARKDEVRAAERYDHDQTTFSRTIKKLVGRYYLDYREDYKAEVNRIRAEVTDPYRRRKAFEKARDSVEPVTDFDVLFVPDSYKTVGLIAPALAVEDIITNVCDTRDLDRIRKTTGDDELHTVRLLGSNTWNNPDLVTRGGKYVRCSVFVDGFFPESRRKATADFVTQYRNVYGSDKTPTYFDATGFDTARIVSDLVEKQHPQDRTTFREALLGVRDFPGATGDTSFAPNGEVEKPLFFLTVDKDAIVEVAPGGAAGN